MKSLQNWDISSIITDITDDCIYTIHQIKSLNYLTMEI